MPSAHSPAGDIRLPRQRNIYHPFAAAHIDAAARGIDEHIICIAAGIQLRRDMPVPGGQDHQGRRVAKDDQKPARIAIDGHWEIRSGTLRGQRSGRGSREIHDLDLASVRHIDKDLGSGFVNLKPLGMSLEVDTPNPGSGFRIDHREPTFAVTHDHAVALRIHPHIVGVVAELDAPGWREVLAAQHPH